MRSTLKQWLFTVSLFIFTFYLYALYSYFGMEQFIQDGVLKTYFDSNVFHLEIIITGVLFGVLFILINRVTEKAIFRKRSFAFNILLRSAFYIIALFLVLISLYYFFTITELVSTELFAQFKDALPVKLILSFIIYWMLFVLFTNFIISISNKFGTGTLIDLLMGKYYHPRSEELVFLFLDLKDSTSIAEQLGHKQYSRFIKECIHELTPVIQKNKARVYQYVGDEVVLYWKKNEGMRLHHVLDTFFDFKEILQHKEYQFARNYGVIPGFKAGMDVGMVTLTEIGDIKREIAFHGDVLNTASRLEKKCNEFNAPFIVSQRIMEQIDSNQKYQFKFLSDLPLRGKAQKLKFYGVSLK